MAARHSCRELPDAWMAARHSCWAPVPQAGKPRSGSSRPPVHARPVRTTPDQTVVPSHDRPSPDLRASCVTVTASACSTVARQERLAARRSASAVCEQPFFGHASRSSTWRNAGAHLAVWIRDTRSKQSGGYDLNRARSARARQARFTYVDAFDGDKDDRAPRNGAVWTRMALANPLAHRPASRSFSPPAG